MMLFESYREGTLPQQAQSHNLSNRQRHPQWLFHSIQLHCNSALNLTIVATDHSVRHRDYPFRDHRRLNKIYFIRSSANLPQTVYSQWTLLSGVCLWQLDSTPHLPVQNHERLASCDSSSQHSALSCAAFSPAVVSWTTSVDKRLPECLACRRFTRTRGDSFWLCTNRPLCTFHWFWAFKSTVGKHIRTGTGNYILPFHSQLVG